MRVSCKAMQRLGREPVLLTAATGALRQLGGYYKREGKGGGGSELAVAEFLVSFKSKHIV